MNPLKAHIITLLALIATFTGAAQSPSELERQGDAKLAQYDFAAASQLYRRAYEASSYDAFRTRMEEKMTQCDNGLSMLSFACKPVVVATKTVPKADFFLYYTHIPADRWGRMADGNLAAFDPSKTKLFFSRDNGGQSDIYTSTLVSDNLWSTPEPLGEAHMSAGDEVMPIVSYDGKKLYYSSKGLFGMGGYDLFVCEWDESAKKWGEPQNLGFPFSSLGDDFLYSDTPDGNFSILASNRDCGADSVTIYVLQFKNEPLKAAVSAAEARSIAALKVHKQDAGQNAGLQEDTSVSFDDPLQRSYAEAMSSFRDLKKELEDLTERQLELQSRIAAATDESDCGLLVRNLTAAEQEMFSKQQLLRTASDKVQAIEMECMLKGVTLDRSLFEEAPKRPDTEEAPLPDYEFSRLMAPPYLNAVFEEPEEQFDYTFKILDEAVIADNAVLEEGLIYQIQILAGSGKVAPRQLHGFSPVFEKKQSNGKYVYCVGKFAKYADAQNALPKVKRYYSSAFIVAFRNGKSMSVTNARKAEATITDKYQLVFNDYPGGIPSAILEVIRANCSKDIARRTSDEGKVIYYIAPFDSASEAERLAAKLRATGAQGISTDIIK